jgi:hypothetical protein
MNLGIRRWKQRAYSPSGAKRGLVLAAFATALWGTWALVYMWLVVKTA